MRYFLLLTALLSFGALAQNKPLIECEPVYIIVTDTSKSYDELAKIMGELSEQIQRSVDTSKQYFPEKDIVGLAEKEGLDPLLVGKYIRRAKESRYLSYEYFALYDTASVNPGLGALEIYDEEVRGQTLCIMAGIYHETHLMTAQEDLKKIQQYRPNAFMILKHDLVCYWVRPTGKPK